MLKREKILLIFFKLLFLLACINLLILVSSNVSNNLVDVLTKIFAKISINRHVRKNKTIDWNRRDAIANSYIITW